MTASVARTVSNFMLVANSIQMNPSTPTTQVRSLTPGMPAPTSSPSATRTPNRLCNTSSALPPSAPKP